MPILGRNNPLRSLRLFNQRVGRPANDSDILLVMIYPVLSLLVSPPLSPTAGGPTTQDATDARLFSTPLDGYDSAFGTKEHEGDGGGFAGKSSGDRKSQRETSSVPLPPIGDGSRLLQLSTP